MVSERARAGAQPLLDGYVEVQGGLPEHLSEGGDTPPWYTSDNTRGYRQGK